MLAKLPHLLRNGHSTLVSILVDLSLYPGTQAVHVLKKLENQRQQSK